MKTVLIPTDYRIASLSYIPQLLSKLYPEEVEVVMVHMMGVTDCVRELLMLSRRSAEYKHITDDFYEAVIKLKQENEGQLKNIRLEFFYGNTTTVFKNFIDANDIDAVLMLEDYEYAKLNKTSIDPVEMIDRCGKKISRIYSGKLENKPAIEVQTLVVEETEDEAILTEQYV